MPLSATSRTSLLNRNQVILEDLYPATATIGGTAYPCAETSDIVSDDFGDGGRVSTTRRVIRIRKSALAAAPARGTLVTMDDGAVLRIIESDTARHDTAWTLILENRDR
jgi:hypothetical protein